MWGVDGHILPKRECVAFHFNETVNLTQDAPRIEDEGSKAESGAETVNSYYYLGQEKYSGTEGRLKVKF